MTVTVATTATAARVSVFIPVFNGEPYLGAAIDSILGQTLRDLELVIVENGSSDGSRQTARRAAARDPRVRIVEHPKPLGIVGAGNAGVAAARAPLVARQDQDDLSDPRRLERQVAALERDRAAVASGTLCDGIDDGGRCVRPRDRWRLVGRSPLPPFPHGSLCVRREVFTRVGGYREGTHRWEDIDLMLRLEREGRVLVLPRGPVPLSLPRRLPDGDERAGARRRRRAHVALRRSPPPGRGLGRPAGRPARSGGGPARRRARPPPQRWGSIAERRARRRQRARADAAAARAARLAAREPGDPARARGRGHRRRDLAAAPLVQRNRAVAWRPR